MTMNTNQKVAVHPEAMRAAQIVINGLINIDYELDGDYDVFGPITIRCDGEPVGTIEWIDDCWQLVVEVST